MAPPRAQWLGILLCLIVFYSRPSEGSGAAPTFDNFGTRATVAENTGTGTSFFKILASDAEGDSLTYAMTSTGDPFTLVGQDLQVGGALDYETTNYYLLNFTVNDGTNTVNGWLNVDVTDVNDNVPVISTTGLGINIDEEQAVGTVVPLTITATDEDAGDTLSYTLTGLHAPYFSMEVTDGTVRIAQRLDREAATPILVYNQLLLTVTDTAGQSATATLTITLDDINDNTPVCTQSTYYTSVPENSPVDTVAQALTCTDDDATTNGAMTVSIVSGDDAIPKFKVSAVGQNILTTATALDFESTASYILVINVVDGGATKNTGTTTVIVTVSPENEFTPVWGPFADPYTVAENANIGTFVAAVTATDADAGSDGIITYSLVTTTDSGSATVAGIFSMDTSGQLSTMTALDREAMASYDVTVRASDGGTPAKTVDKTFTINIGDYNDQTPVFTGTPYSKTLPETSTTAAGTSIIQVAATDADATSTLTYHIESGDTTRFQFNSDVLELKTAINLDSPSNDPDNYLLSIIVKDGGTPELTGTTSVTVSITAFNDHDPVIGAGFPSTVEFPESTVVGSAIETVIATDLDAGVDGQISYSITAGNTNSDFNIATSSGLITLLNSLDFATTPSYSLEVTASDGGSPVRSVTTIVTVNVKNGDAPTFDNFGTRATVAENTGTGTSFFKILASDAEGDSLTYAMTSTGVPFALVGQDLQVGGALDYETTNYYLLNFTVSDGTNTVNGWLNVDITDVNDNVPVISATGLSINIDEEQAVGTVVPLTITATDDDAGETLSYTLTGLHAPYFSMEVTDGTVRIAQRLDREAATPILVYNQLLLTVTDTAGQSATATLTVRLDDINDNTPVCTQSTYYTSVPENSPVDTTAQALTCTDDDAAPNGDMTVTIVSGDDATPKFKVSAIGQNILTTATTLNYETTTSYNLVIHVIDGGATKNTGTTTVVVTVTPENEFTPVWGAFADPYTVAENANIGTFVAAVTATDADAGSDGIITYSLVTTTDSGGGTVAGIFSMDTSGQLSTMAALNRETMASYDVTVRASDGGSPAKTVDKTFTINIGDYNDQTPVFTGTPYSKTLLETSTTAAGTSVIQVAATDADATSILTYHIESGDTTRFQFNADVLELKTAINLDSPSNDPDNYLLSIIVKDGGTPELTGTTSVTVSITAVNDHDPVIGAGFPSTVEFPESTAVGTAIETVVATDLDVGVDGQISYSITAGNTNSDFNIATSSGLITLLNSLDFATTPSYSLEVTASDGGSPVRSVTTIVTVNVKNGDAPIFDNFGTRATVAENTGTGTSFFKILASDAEGDSLTYAMTSTGVPFALVGQDLQVGGALDYTTTNYYLLNFTVSDGTNTVNGWLNVDITDVNDNVPVISATGLSINIDEEQAVGTVVPFTITATDDDAGDTLSYTLTDLHAPYFSMEVTDGTVRIAQRLDREAATPIPVYNQLLLTVTDTAGQSATATLTVTLDDINDNTPVCTQSTYYTSVPENSPVDTTAQALTCTDDDAAPNGDMTVTIVSGDDATPKFKVSAIGQNILTTATALDYETTTSYTLVIHVIDGGATKNTGTTTVAVTVSSENESPPVWGTFADPYTVAENVNVGTAVATVAATDADAGSDGTITYSLVTTLDSGGGTVAGIFSMDPWSGQLSTMSTLDRETMASYDVTVRASDGGSPAKTVDKTFTINIGDYNDQTPVFTGGPYSNTLPETSTTAAGTSIIQVAATDADATSILTYHIESGDTTRFQFNADVLELKTAINLDSPSNDPDYYLLRVIVKDGGTPELTGTTSVTVSITAVNDHDPVFGAGFPSTVAFPESTAVGTSIETVLATDLDTGVDGQISYSITGGNANGDFNVAPTSGLITLLNPLNFDTTPSYSLELTASDGGASVRTVTTVVTVTVSGVNDNAPSCTSYVVYVNMLESSAVNDPVTALSCSDADSDPVTYSITSGNTDGKFALDLGTGAVTLAAALDYDSATISYSLAIQVTDGSYTRTVTVNVDVGPVDEDTPAFATNPTTSIAESDAPGKVVHTYAAADTDYSPHDITQYAITAVTQSGVSKFSIDESSAVITLTSSVDYDTLPAGTKFYEITVTATDGGGLVGTGTVTVSVTDVNDNPPSCTPSSVTTTVPENTATTTTIIASLGCTDVEDGTTLTYSLIQTPGTHFGVTAGAVTLDTAIDYETNTDHTLTITVTDAGTTAQSTTVTVNINVGNVNDGPPTFTGTFAKTIVETINPGTSVMDVVASDPDGNNEFGNLVYSIDSGDASNQFSIDPNTGRISTISNLDRETTPSYDLVVKAKESGDTGSATVTATITISDVNDTPPSCTQTNFIITVSEAESAGFVVNTFTCTDPDTTGTLTYTLTSGDATKFEMSTNNLQLKAPLDYDSGVTKYDVTVTISDSVNSVVVTGTIHVGNVNEAPPVFLPVIYSVSHSEDTPLSSVIATVIATDADSSSTPDGQIAYGFVTTYPLFALNTGSGVITLASFLDWETGPTHDLLVTATDGTSTVTATVSVTVDDVNEHAPVFGSPTYSGAVSEADGIAASVVVTVAATDQDDPATSGNGQVTYSIIAGDTNSDFTIDTNNGQITTAKQLDYETAVSYLLTVQAIDRAGDAQSKSATAVVSVTVTNENEFDPVFSPSPILKSVPETQAVGTSLLQAIATDADSGVDGDLTYTMPAHAKFTLAVNGDVILKDSLIGTGPTYTLTITATDGGTPARSADVTATITITDVNVDTPSCSPSSIVVTKREDATGNVASLSCTDTDAGASGTLTYIIESVNAVAGTGPFSINAGTGDVSIGTTLDYETATAHTIIIRVQDGAVPALSTTATVDVSVTDVNEAAPVFSGTPFNVNMDESEAVGFTLLTVAATDADSADSVTYSLTDTTNILIGSTSGIITLKVQQDKETTATFSSNVCATDSGVVDAVKTTCETITVTVTDVNDNSPVFNPGVYTANVDENTASGTTVTTVTATDKDSGLFGTVTYSIASGNTDSVFAVDSSLGHITVASPNTFLDYERTQSFTLTVRAADGGTPALTADVSVTITVNPVNEASPTFTPASSTQTVPENSAGGTTVIDLDATDADTGPDGQITYSIISGASGKFTIDPSTGEVTVSGVLDIETVPSYTITIQATDAGTNPSAFVGTYTLTVTVTDYNDKTPTCTSSYYSASISESTTPSTSVQQLVCNDGDTDSPNNVLAYNKTGGDPTNLFDVDSSTGLVSVAPGATFDRETIASYLLDINVQDGGTPSLSVDIQVFVSISDVNDQTPAFGQDPYNSPVAENAAPGAAVGTINAIDNDVGTNAEVVYSITGGNGLGHFILDSATGILSVQAPLDREALALYVLDVQAQDKGTPSLSGTSTVSITVTDVNDNAPICSSSVYTATTPEDTTTGTLLATVACTDADDPPNNNVQYTITAGNTGTAFAVHITTGDVTVASALDAETTMLYTLTVQASDGTLTTDVIVTITVTDVNEFDPAFTPAGPYSVSFAEDTALGTTIKDIDATDGDISNTALLFSIAGGNTGNKFWINTLTGEVILQAALDRENLNTYSLSIEVADGTGAGSRTATTILTVPVLDVNDNDPSCTPSVYIKTLPEDSIIGTTVSSLTCSDVDSSTPTPAYTITTGNAAGKFNIDAASGIVTVANLLDYESITSYTLGVEVSDQGTTPRNITVPVTVDVSPVNEHDPVFTAVTPVTHAEDVAIGTLIYQVIATDADDGGLHGSVRYSITSGDTLGQFNINQGTGEIKTVGSLDRESLASYSLKIRATDDFAGSGNERSAEIDLVVNVGDVNDNIPTFTPVVYAQNVLESAPSGSTLVQVTSRDDDDVPNATPVYSIISGNTGSVFTFVGNELLLDTGKTLDFETVTQYDLVIEVSDSGSPPLNSSGKIIITVLSVNEYPPIPAVPNDSITMSEATPVGTNFYNASASDADAGTDGEFTWSITNGNVPVTFFCSPQLGELYTSSVLDFDNPPSSYNITVEAQDNSGLKGDFWLEIALTDENDEYPIFTETLYKPLLNENVGINAPVVTVIATDNDSGLNGQVTYSITSGDVSFFQIDNSTGAISTLKDIDYETKNIFFLILGAVDGGSPPLSTVGAVKITVVDLNDNDPVFTPDYFAQSISEDVTVGTSVATVYATDADSTANNNNVFTYSLTDTYFEVNPTTGQISTKAALDRETIPSHNLTILAIDQGPTPLTGTTLVTVNLDDVNDNDPVITGTYDTNLSEDINTGVIVFTITASDIDEGVNAELEYTIVSGNTDGDFKIEIGSGIVQVKNTLDRERTTSYNPVIHVIDKGTTRRTASVTTTITIDDVNDNNPIFTTSPYTFNIAENVPLGSTVGVILATDQDALTNAAQTYEIVVFWTGDASHFTIDTSSGEIKTTGNLDRESIATYSLRCRAKDGGTPQLSGDVNVTITIDDLNDNAPVFSSTSYSGSVDENTAVGTSILTVVVTDSDPSNGEITLSIDTSSANGIRGDMFLAIDSATGIISVKAVMDRENDASFNVMIVAVDNGTVPFTSTANVSITVNDVNDNRPVFGQTFYNTEVAHTGICDSNIVTLTATDADSGTNGRVTYYFSANPYGFYFAIGSSTGIASLQSPGSVDTKYVLEASANDNGVPSRVSNPPAALRVDTFDPNKIAVTIRLRISKADFLLRQAQFVSQFRTVMASKYPTCIVRVWCIKERSGEAVPAPTRRRLLATSPIDVNMIVVADNKTEFQSNLADSKTFVTSGAITSLVTSDASGTPSSALQGAAWDYFLIESVKPYSETVTPWYQTTVGIVFIVLACLLALALIIVTIFAICYCRKKKKRPITPTRVLVEEKRPNQKKMFVSRAAVPDLDIKDLKNHPPPAVVSLPMPAKAENVPRKDSFWGAPENRSEKPRVETSGRDSLWTPDDRNNLTSPRTPRSVIITTKNDTDGYYIRNRHFDGTAVDPVTNKVYEYNTKTNERRWLSTPEGKAVVVTDSLISDV